MSPQSADQCCQGERPLLPVASSPVGQVSSCICCPHTLRWGLQHPIPGIPHLPWYLKHFGFLSSLSLLVSLVLSHTWALLGSNTGKETQLQISEASGG